MGEKSLEKMIKRNKSNPLLTPREEHDEGGVYNSAVLKLGDTTFLIPRVRRASTQQSDFTLAWTEDNKNFQRLNYPIMFAKEPYEIPHKDVLASERERGGIEDPRATIINNRIYLPYTALHRDCHIAIASISVEKFKKLWKESMNTGKDLREKWNNSWERHGLVFPDMFDKGGFSRNACLGQVEDLYSLIYRKNYKEVMMSFSEKPSGSWKDKNLVFLTKKLVWEGDRIGISSPPIHLSKDLILYLYHGAEAKPPYQGSDYTKTYHIGLLFSKFEKKKNKLKVTNYRMEKPLLSPIIEELEKCGDWLYNDKFKVAAVFSCGAVLLGRDKLNIYYSVGDEYVCSATAKPLTIFNKEKFLIESQIIDLGKSYSRSA